MLFSLSLELETLVCFFDLLSVVSILFDLSSCLELLLLRFLLLSLPLLGDGDIVTLLLGETISFRSCLI